VTRRQLPVVTAAVEALGAMIVAGRRERGWTQDELAARLGTTRPTLRRIEQGEPTVAIGLVFDAAVLCGVQLFSADPGEWSHVAREAGLRAALLPSRVRSQRVTIDDDF
jgi:transcriptional regulator with XRE-family HTH domain